VADIQCPRCRKRLAKQALEGGLIFKARYVIVMPDGKLRFACPFCATESEDPHKAKSRVKVSGHGKPG
jgi:hypothetical protein